MFEGASAFYEGVQSAQGVRLRAAQAEADEWRAYAARLEERIREQEGRIGELEGELNLAGAVILGREAQMDEMEKALQGSPLMADSGARFTDGKVKTKLRLVFEQTFDAALRSVGIENPEAYRAS